MSARSIKARINMYALGSTALRASLLSDDDSVVKAPKVRSFITHRNTEKEFAGSRGFGFIRPMKRAQVTQYFAANQNDPGYPKSVTSLTEKTDPHSDVFLVEAIEPIWSLIWTIGIQFPSLRTWKYSEGAGKSMPYPAR